MNGKNAKTQLVCERHKEYRIVTFVLFVASLFLSMPSSASLLITPSRVVFEDRTRSEQVTLSNKGNETTTYRISFIRQNMTEDGNFVPVNEGEEGMYSDGMVRYSPRQITLAPGQSQIVRLLLRKPRGLADGEYRSHMLLQALPAVTKSDISKAVETSGDGITVEITTIIGVSIPVIVRNGKLTSEVNLANARYVKSTSSDKKSLIVVNMNRAGAQSAYGDFRVTHIDDKGSEYVAGILKGVAIYTPNLKRSVQILLNTPDGKPFTSGRFEITYSESGKDKSSGLIAVTELKI